MVADRAILVINSGSSSVKFSLFLLTESEPQMTRSGELQRIGLSGGRFVMKDAEGNTLADETREIPNHVAAFELLLTWIERRTSRKELVAVGHRVVHGGEKCDCSLVVTPALESQLKRLTPLAPLHLPNNLAGIIAVRLRRPDLPQIASFDTAFHRTLPQVAQMTALPRRFERDGILRYGFHGLSYEYVIEEVRRRDGDAAARQRTIVAHLGNGASMAALNNGASVETTTGFSTLAGLPMGTRTGDLDPGILLHLLTEKQIAPDALQHLLYEDSGMLGISERSRNMADLLAQQDVPEVAEAVEYFCYQARRHLAGLMASLGGLGRLIFTGGIGANSPEIRARICHDLAYLNLRICSDRNEANERIISKDAAPVLIEAFQTNEELVIARHTQALVSATSPAKKRARAYG